MYGPVFDSQTKEWIKLHIDELLRKFQKHNLVEDMVKRRLMQADHAWHKRGSIVKLMTSDDPMRKNTVRETKAKMRRLFEEGR